MHELELVRFAYSDVDHSLFKSALVESPGIGEWRFKFRSSEDDLREVTVHVFLVNIYC